MISYKGFNEKHLTFKASGSLTAGMAVKVSANGTVAKCADGDAFCGVVTSVRGDIAVVQVSGYVRMPYSGTTAPALGVTTLAADANGGVKSAKGVNVKILELDPTNGVCGFIF